MLTERPTERPTDGEGVDADAGSALVVPKLASTPGPLGTSSSAAATPPTSLRERRPANRMASVTRITITLRVE